MRKTFTSTNQLCHALPVEAFVVCTTNTNNKNHNDLTNAGSFSFLGSCHAEGNEASIANNSQLASAANLKPNAYPIPSNKSFMKTLLRKSKALSLGLAFLLFASFTNAQVTVTPATGGTNISADKAANAAAGSFTTLGNIVLTASASGNFSVGANQTLILTAPIGWNFKPSTGSVGVGSPNDFSSVPTINVSSTTITVTYSITSTSKADVLTISLIQVQAIEGGAISSSGSIYRATGAGGGTATISGITTTANADGSGSGVTNFGSLTQVVGAINKLLVTLPGETFTDAATKAASGNSGTVTAQTAGTAFNIPKITATDQFFNIITSYSGAKTISYSGPGGSPTYTSSVSFTLGVSTTTLATNLLKAETTTITASDGTTTGPASSGLTVNAGIFSKLRLLMPGVTAAPGTATGKSGTPTAQTAGTPFNVTVDAVDANWNVVSSTDNISITSSDPAATLPPNVP